MEDRSHYESVGEDASEVGRDSRGFILAGLAGSLIGLFGIVIGTFLTLSTWPIGPLPYTELIIALRAVISLASTIGFFLFVLGIYGLSIQYRATILSLVAIIEGGLLILHEAMNRFLSPTFDINAVMTLAFVFYSADVIMSVVFGITLLRIRERAPQPVIFLGYGLIEVFWPPAYFLLAFFDVGLLYLILQSTALTLDILGTILFLNEYRRYPIVVDSSDRGQHSQVWE